MIVADPKEDSVVGRVEDLSWFQGVLEESKKVLEATPENSRPSWYREHIAIASESSK